MWKNVHLGNRTLRLMPSYERAQLVAPHSSGHVGLVNSRVLQLYSRAFFSVCVRTPHSKSCVQRCTYDHTLIGMHSLVRKLSFSHRAPWRWLAWHSRVCVIGNYTSNCVRLQRLSHINMRTEHIGMDLRDPEFMHVLCVLHGVYANGIRVFAFPDPGSFIFFTHSFGSIISFFDCSLVFVLFCEVSIRFALLSSVLDLVFLPPPVFLFFLLFLLLKSGDEESWWESVVFFFRFF